MSASDKPRENIVLAKLLDQLQSEIETPQLQHLTSPELEASRLRLSVLRLDSIHPEIQGNKWFKLRLNLARAIQTNHSRVISFGGAYSNHLYALAAAGSALGLATVGVVRGEITDPSNPVIQFLKQKHMRLIPVSRTDYRRKDDPSFQAQILEEIGPSYIIPEGGSNAFGVEGCEAIAEILAAAATLGDNTVIATACGTGATMAGVVSGAARLGMPWEVLGVSVLNAPGYLGQEVSNHLSRCRYTSPVWSVSDDYHFGGYAKTSLELAAFIASFSAQHGLPLEPVYTGKLFFALDSMIRQDKFAPGSHICALHTGGIIQF